MSRRVTLAIAAAAVALLLTMTVVAGLWRAGGGRWETVESPSMGTWAPVGTLLWVRPVHQGDRLRIGDVISFHPPTAPGQTYTHRITAITADGHLHTRGDLNATTDPWTLSRSNVSGVVAHRTWYGGWVLKAAPILVVGFVLVWLLTRYFCRRAWRLPARIMGAAFVVSLAVYVVKPLFGARLISLTTSGGDAHAAVVGTGILPVALTGNDGSRVVVRPGQLGQLTVTRPDDRQLYSIHVSPHMPWWLIVLACVVVLLPALWTALVGLPPAANDDQLSPSSL